MARPENRDLIGLGYPVTADPMTCDGQQWIAANFDAAKRWTRTCWRIRIRSRSTRRTKPELLRDNGIRFSDNGREPQSAPVLISGQGFSIAVAASVTG